VGRHQAAPGCPATMTCNEGLARGVRGLTSHASGTVETLLAGLVGNADAKAADRDARPGRRISGPMMHALAGMALWPEVVRGGSQLRGRRQTPATEHGDDKVAATIAIGGTDAVEANLAYGWFPGLRQHARAAWSG
jgi:hypothetical protein